MGEVVWSKLREEAMRLTHEIGENGREHHSLLKNFEILHSIRTSGIPKEHREWIWPTLLHASSQRLKRSCTDVINYHTLLDFEEDELVDDNEKVHLQQKEEMEQAKEMVMEKFDHLNPFQERKIKRILLSYTKTKEIFFYCHGLLEICVVLSTFLTEEETFWIFRLCVDEIFPKYHHHEDSVIGFQTDHYVLQTLLDLHDPSLSQHFQEIGFSIQFLCTKWFFSFFAESMPFEFVCRLYDILFLDTFHGNKSPAKIILSTSLGVLVYLSQMLKEVHDPTLVLELIHEFCWTSLGDFSIAESFFDLVMYLHDQVLLDQDIQVLRTNFLEQTETPSNDANTTKEQVTEKVKKLVINWQTAATSCLNASSNRNSMVSTTASSPIADPTTTASSSKKDIPPVVNDDDEEKDNTEKAKGIMTRQVFGPPKIIVKVIEMQKQEGQNQQEEDAPVPMLLMTPNIKEQMLRKLSNDLQRVNRRRSRSSSSLRNINLLLEVSPNSSKNVLEMSITPNDASSASINAETRAQAAMSIETPDELMKWKLLKSKPCANQDDLPEELVHELCQLSFYGVPDPYRRWAWPHLIRQALLFTNGNKCNSPLHDRKRSTSSSKNRIRRRPTSMSPPLGPSSTTSPPLPPLVTQEQDRQEEQMEEEEEDFCLDREVEKAIENDLTRTRNIEEHQREPMRRILQAFAKRNRRVGYCQGMNEILAILLKYVNESMALDALVLLIEKLLPAYHVDSMIGLHTDCAVLDTLMKQNDPELHAHLTEMGLNMEILCTKWFIACFLTTLPLNGGLRVLDMVFSLSKENSNASRVLLGIGISIFFHLRLVLFECKEPGEILMTLSEFLSSRLETHPEELDHFLMFCGEIIQQLTPMQVEELRTVHRDDVMERFAAFEAKKIEMRQQQQLEKAKAMMSPPLSAMPAPSSSSPPQLSAAIVSAAMCSTVPSATIQPSPSSSPVLSSTSTFSRVKLTSYLTGKKNPTTVATNTQQETLSYQRLDVDEANRTYFQDLEQMEEQLDDLADLFERGKIDEKELECIRAQIVRKCCKTINSPQSVLVRVRHVKHLYTTTRTITPTSSSSTASMTRRYSHPPMLNDTNINSNNSSTTMVGGGQLIPANGSDGNPSPPRKGSMSSIYGRMKKAKANAMAMFKSL